MAALEFPASPTIGDTYDAPTGTTYTWNGASWVSYLAPVEVPVYESAIVEDVSTTTYTLVSADADNKYKRLSNAAGCAVTVPPNASVAIAVDTTITFRSVNAGSSLVAGSGVTLTSMGASGLSFSETGAVVQIKKVATDTWDVIGGVS